MAATIEDRGQETAGMQLGDQQVKISHLDDENAGPVAVADAEPSLYALVAISTEYG